MNKKILTKLVGMALLLIPAQLSFGQVTIGSSNLPAKGALLDLKEKESTATDATTAGKCGITGTCSAFNDNGIAPTPANRVQGICPNGWHLPSDYEWTVLENKFISNTSAFSSSATIGGTEFGPTSFFTGTQIRVSHAKTMKEICERPTVPNKIHRGTSNEISTTVRSGFEVFMAAYANATRAFAYGEMGTFWTPSSQEAYSATARSMQQDSSDVTRFVNSRFYLYSVRCKKDI